MADIKVNAQQWGALSSEDQKRVSAILSHTGLLKAGTKIVSDPGTAAIQVAAAAGMRTQSIFCEIACDVAEAAAHAACFAIALAPPALILCEAAATAGGQLCRDQC